MADRDRRSTADTDKDQNIDRRDVLKLAATGAVTIPLAGCPGGQQDTGVDSSAGDGTEGDFESILNNEIVHINVSNVEPGPDPALSNEITDVKAAYHIYDTALFVDPDRMVPVENLVTDWSTENDAQIWELTVKEGVPLHRGGELDAQDLAYTIERMLEIGQGFSTFWSGILNPENIEVVDDYVVRFEFDEPFGPFIGSLVPIGVVDSETVQENEVDGDYGQEYLAENAAGSGPYTIESFNRGSELVLTAFEDYWKGWSGGQFGRATIRIIEEMSTAMNEMRVGNADVLDANLAKDAKNEMDSLSHVKVPESEMFRLHYTHMNTTKPPLDDPNVRKAIAHSYDYEELRDEVFGGGQIAAGPVPRPMAEFHNGDVPVSTRDPDRAQQLIEDSSYTVDEINEITMEHMATSGSIHDPLMLLLNEGLSEVLGIESHEIRQTQWATLADATSSPETTPHFVTTWQTAKFPAPTAFLDLMFLPSEFGTHTAAHYLEDEEVVNTIESARTAATREERIQLWKEAQMMIYEAQPILFYMNPDMHTTLNASIEGWEYYGAVGLDQNSYHLSREGDRRDTP